MQKTILLLFLALSSTYLKAQVNLDSLYAIWQDKAQTDSLRAYAYESYIWDGFLFSNPDSAFILAEELVAFAKAKKIPWAEAQAYGAQGISFQVGGNSSEALAYHERGLKIKEQLGNKKGIASSLNNIGNIYDNLSNYPKALDYIQRSLNINEELGNKGGIASSLNSIGNIYDAQGDISKALDYLQRSLKIYEEIGNKSNISILLNNIGVIYKSQPNYPQALDYHHRSLKISEELGNKRGIATSLNNIGVIYKEQANYSQSLDYHQRSLKIKEEIGDKDGIGASLNNIGNIHDDQGNYPMALDYHQRSLKIKEEIGDKRGIALSLNNIGVVYREQGNYATALDYHQRSLKIKEEIGDKDGVANSLNNIGRNYYSQSMYNRAITECKKALTISEEIGVISRQKGACSVLYVAYKGLGNNTKALEYYEQYTILNDSLFNEKNTKKLTQLSMQYEFDKQEAATKMEQEKKDAIATQELKRKKLERNGFMGGFAVVLLFAGIFFRQRNRIGKEKERSEELLMNILPKEVAEELKEKGHSDAQLIDHVTVLFTDFKGFTSLSEQLSPKELVADLHACFSKFDRICEKYGIEKIKTIGDAYMAAGGLPSPNNTHAQDVVKATLEMAEVVEKAKVEKTAANQPFFEVRIGVHTGPVVAGIVGIKKFQYDIWGDTVNTASRMESSGEVGMVNISEATYKLLKGNADFTFETRGKIKAKGKGEMEMYFVRAI